jgi:hypothetical protein
VRFLFNTARCKADRAFDDEIGRAACETCRATCS